MHEHYGIDLGTPGILQDRSWRWLQQRVAGLLSVPWARNLSGTWPTTRIQRALAPTPARPDEGAPQEV